MKRIHQPRRRVLIAGYYGFQNIGDEAILTAMLAQMRSRRPDLLFTVTSARPEQTAAAHGVISIPWWNMDRVAAAVRESDLVVVGGGGLFHDYGPFDPGAFLTDDHSGIGFYAAPLLLARLTGKPAMLYGVGIGPLKTPQSRTFTRIACDCANLITVRDEESRELLVSLGVKAEDIEVTADPAFQFKPVDEPRADPPSCRPVIAVALRPWSIGVHSDFWERELAAALDIFRGRNQCSIRFVSFQHGNEDQLDDAAIAERVRGRMSLRDCTSVLPAALAAEDAFRVIRNSDLVIGMRLHSLIFAMSSAVPAIALCYDPKNLHLMRRMQLEHLALPMSDLDAGRLAALIEETLGARANYAKKIAARCAGAAAGDERNAALAMELLDTQPRRRRRIGTYAISALAKGLESNIARAGALRSENGRLLQEINFSRKHAEENEARSTEAIARLETVGQDLERARADLGTWRSEAEKLGAQVDELRQRLDERESDDAVKPAVHPSLPALHPSTPLAGLIPQRKYDVLIFAVFDFDSRYQRPQQIAMRFAQEGHRVFWISPFRRMAESGGRLYEFVPIAENLFEVHLRGPRHGFYSGELSAQDAQTLYSAVCEFCRDQAVAESCAIVQFPFWRQVALELRREFGTLLAYDCIDDWRNWTAAPAISSFNLAEEEKIVHEADALFVTAEHFAERYRALGLDPVLVRNAADFNFFQSASNVALRAMQRPIVGYYGAIADWFDVQLVIEVARSRPQYSFVLIGHVHEVDIDRLRELPNVHLLGEKSYSELPGYLRNFDVCIIPFLLNRLTVSVDPVKLYEYLSRGKPVVATAMPELPRDPGLLYIAENAADFAAKVDRALQEDEPGATRRRIEFAAANTWKRRVEIMDRTFRAKLPSATVLIVTHNSEDYLPACLDSIERYTAGASYEVIVVDNASRDSTAQIVRQRAARDPRILPVLLQTNTGFAAGNNLAARQGNGEYLVFLNPDTIVSPGWLHRLIQHCERDGTVAQVAAVTNFSGNETKVNFTYANVIEMQQFAVNRAREMFRMSIEIPVAPLYCVLMPRWAWERIGELDEQFGVGTFEDDDLSLRAREAGLRVIAAEDVFIHHFGNASFGRIPTSESLRIFAQNRSRFENKWRRPWSRHCLRPGVRSAYQEPRLSPAEFLTVREPAPEPAVAAETPPDAVAPTIPLVSCIMPTADRRAFVPRAIRQFLAQDYPERELIVVDGGAEPVSDLMPSDGRIRYFRADPAASVGALRNMGCRCARGEYIAHWDDDDWIAHWRLSYQMQAMLETGADICGIDRLYCWDPRSDRVWRYTYPRDNRAWLAGGTMLYKRGLWEQRPFADVDVGEDNQFVWSDAPKRIAALDDEDFYVALVHPGNTSPKAIEPSRWIQVDAAPVLAALGADAEEYRRLVDQHSSALAPQAPLPLPDEAYFEYEVFRYALKPSGDLAWAVPFAFFEARLFDGARICDCSIDSGPLREAVAALYPYTPFNRWPAVVEGRMAKLPPDGAGAFDRIFCIDTFERLAEQDRESLAAALSESLGPGGMLLITCSGEVLTAQAFEELCRRHGLGKGVEFHHRDAAGFGAVWTKPPQIARRPKKIVLGLLTWNGRDVAMESLAALVREAGILQRLGCEASICVVDNGSTDGLADDLEQANRDLAIPHRIIVNPRNEGSSHARNRMIDYLFETGGDYILFLDGDIELVPFSSFAMLRYLEVAGVGVGCIGAYSGHFTADRREASPFLLSIFGRRFQSSELLAWTQYGMFRREAFDEGVRFETSGPFGEPGHGLEDVDLAFQLRQKGFANECFEGMRYLHRDLSSSVAHLRAQGVNPTERYYLRKIFLLSKWAASPEISTAAKRWLSEVRAPWPEDPTPAGAAPRAGLPQDLVAAPAAALELIDRFATDMINRPHLTVLARVLASFPWSGREIAVEIGAYIGSTTVFIAKVLETLNAPATVLAIDPFERCQPDALNPQGSYQRFIENIRASGVESRCVAMVAFSKDAAPSVPSNIGVLFVDGAHHYETVRLDLELYSPKVVAGGLVFIHDYFSAYPGVMRATDEFAACHPEFEAHAGESFVIMQRLATAR